MKMKLSICALFAMMFGLLLTAADGEEPTKQSIEEANTVTKEFALASKRLMPGPTCGSVGGTVTHGKIVGIEIRQEANEHEISMSTDLYCSKDEKDSILFIEYLLCRRVSDQKLVLKQANSILLKPGVGICGIPMAALYDLKPGEYKVAGVVTTRNSDNSETVRDVKSKTFIVK